MLKKSHLSWHDNELYLKEKIGKRELVQKKNHYINELNEILNCQIKSEFI